jgi:hypothetical protein
MKLFVVNYCHADPQMDLNGHHELSMPILWCPLHGQRMSYNVHYPCFDVNVFPLDLRAMLIGYAGNYADLVHPDQLTSLVSAVAKYCPRGMFIGPSVEFGPFHVETEYGARADFNYFELGQLGASPEAIAQMDTTGVRLPPSRSLVTKREHSLSRGFREFEIHRNVKAARSMGLDVLERCPACGKFLEVARLTVPIDRIVLAKKSVPAGQDLFRWTEYDNIFFASERFVNAFHDLGLRGLAFEEVGVE